MQTCKSTFSKAVFISFAFFTPIALSSVAAEAELQTLSVAAGETYRLEAGLKFLDLSKLELGDKSSLIIPANQGELIIRAEQVRIGKGAKILGQGLAGQAGTNGFNFHDSAENCEEPKAGGAGTVGGVGGDGLDLNLDWNIVAFGSLLIDLSGGAAGRGGNGGRGQDADQDENCSLQRGGNAGSGGKAGRSGNGGNLVYKFRSDDNHAKAFSAKERTKVMTQAGDTAESGKAGAAGKGSAGRYVLKKTLAGNRSWVSGGKQGKVPKNLPAGEAGLAGTISFQLPDRAPVVRKHSEQATSQPSLRKSEPERPSTTEERLRNLEAQIERLTKRLEHLEGAK